MPSLNRLKRELLLKIVFYGPGLGGKTTTLRHVHEATKPENRGELVSLATDTDRTLYFDYLPVKLLQVGDVTVKLQLYTVPGQVYYAATRRLVLNGVDGLVFVADTQAARLDANLESLDDLNANLAEQGRKLSALPHVFQWNKRDLPDLVPLDELDRRLNLFGTPSVATVATTGEGVFDVLERITRLVIEAYRAELPAPSARRETPVFLDAEEVGLADAIKGLADSQPARSRSSAEPVSTTVAGPASVPEPAPASGSPASSSGNPGGGFSLADLWPQGDRDGARSAEQLIVRRDYAGAVGACEDLLSRVLAAASVMLGGQPSPRDPVIVVSLLGLDGVRYMAFRTVARSSRARREPTQRETLDAYLFVVEARRALDRVTKGPGS
ncbi:MAG TPA: GTPase domain-containing protein [Polyangiaceae bacterium]|jgi:signal recognition particle receptor subunit beta